MGTLALLAILGLAALGQLPSLHDDEAALKPGWSLATRSYPAFAVSRLDSSSKPISYTILRHPAGGRRDVLRWADNADRPIAELEIYRPGGERDPSRPAVTDMPTRMGLGEAASLEEAGLVDSKFGLVALFRAEFFSLLTTNTKIGVKVLLKMAGTMGRRSRRLLLGELHHPSV